MNTQKTQKSLQAIIYQLNNGSAKTAEYLAKKILKIQPNSADAANLCGVSCLMQKKYAQARDLFHRALRCQEHASFYLNLALAERGLQDDQAAAEALRRCLSLEPQNAQAANNLANILDHQQLFDEAESLYRQAIISDPKYLLAHMNLIDHLRKRGLIEDAIPITAQALNLNPQNTDLRLQLARDLRSLERYQEAAVYFEKAGQWGDLQLILRRLVDWSQLKEVDTLLLQQLKTSIFPTPPWGLINIPEISPALHRDAAYHYANFRLQAELESPAIVSERILGERLRIGYLSNDFYAHATMHLMIGVLEAHDSSKVEIHIFNYGSIRDDSFTRRLNTTGLPHHNLSELSDEAAARVIADEHIHILVDLKGYTTGARLGITALRPAPIIVNWLGYPGTLGHPRLADYLIGDPVVSPPTHAEHFSETLALMPHCYQPNDRTRRLPLPPTRTDAGLPEVGLVLGSFNQLLKLNPQELDIWCSLMQEVPDSILWVLDPDIKEARDNLKKEIQQRGIKLDRLIFAPGLPPIQHLARLQLVDLALDSFPYTSHTTASDALWAGVPLVARLGENFASRVSASLLSAHGFDELITQNINSYVQLLKELALNNKKRMSLRARLMAARLESPLFNTHQFTKNLEKLYHGIWEHHNSNVINRPLVVSI